MKNVFSFLKKRKKSEFVKGDIVKLKPRANRLKEYLGSENLRISEVINDYTSYPALRDIKYSGGQILGFNRCDPKYYSVAFEKVT